MPNYINELTLDYPITEQEIKASTPNISYPAIFSAEGYAVVYETPKPDYNPITRFVREITPELTELGSWEQRWEIVALAPETVASNIEAASAELQAAIVVAVQNSLDDFARTKGYDGILSACTYVSSEIPSFAAEGLYCVQARDAAWSTCYQIVGAVLAQLRPAPTVAELLAELPVLAWPA